MTNSEIKGAAAARKQKNIPAFLDPKAVRDLIVRVAGEAYAQAVEVFPLNQKDDGLDAYRVFDRKGKIVIEATSGVAACVAFNQYLKQRCDCYIGPLNQRLCLPENPPEVGREVANASCFYYRYLFNFCTFGYTFAFTDWPVWEKVLDYAMLSGYNLILNPIGHESVWRKVLMALGYKDEETGDFLAGPAFLAWQWMMNMSGWGGRNPLWWYEEQADISRRFTDRLRSFGCGIALPGYSGMVPHDFGKRFPASHPIEQGDWCGYDRPPVIVPGDDMFEKVADLFYSEQKKMSGGTSYAHYYSIDPFHEGGNEGGISLADYASGTFRKMEEHDPEAVWFLQGWTVNPRREMVNALDKSRVLVGNLNADRNINGGDNFAGAPWLYCTINNFGGQRLLRGGFINSILRPHAAVKNEDFTMVGIGYMPEGVAADEVFFDVVADLAIHEEPLAWEPWLSGFVRNRYGMCNENLLEAWRILAFEIYVADGMDGPRESALLARPSMEMKHVNTWGSDEFTYDNQSMIRVCRLMQTAYAELGELETYRFDLADFTRQAVANHAWTYAEDIKKAYEDNNREDFEQAAKAFLGLYPIQEALVSTNRHMLLGTWIETARKRGHTAGEKAFMEWNARTQITTWGHKSGAVELHEYAAKEWQGMLSDFYKPRFERFVTRVRLSMETGHPIQTVDDYEQESAFSFETKSYPTEPFGDLEQAVKNALSAIEKE